MNSKESIIGEEVEVSAWEIIHMMLDKGTDIGLGSSKRLGHGN